MELATTKKFRKVVRKVAAKYGVDIRDSYTNSRPTSGDRRTVGFRIGHADLYTEAKLVEKIEKKLNKKGLTANTRITGDNLGMPAGLLTVGMYIRGTCVISN